MKLFINDWCGNREDFVMNVEENKEYPINTWITTQHGERVYLASVYVYDEFVMFFYLYDRSRDDNDRKTQNRPLSYPPKTNRDAIMQTKNFQYSPHISFEYEVNSLERRRGSSGECMPRQRPEGVPEEEQDEFLEMYYGEYDYLCDLAKDRLPEELKGVSLGFWKDCYAFSEPVTEIEHMAIYPSDYEMNRYLIDKTFTVPYGECDIKIPYAAGGIESYIIVKELQIFDMLKTFEDRYDEFKKAHESALQESKKEKQGHQYERVMSLEEIRQHYDKRLLTLSYLKPEEKRMFEFHTTDYLNTSIESGSGSGSTTGIISGKEIVGDLYKTTSALGEMEDAPKSECEITLMSATDPVEYERKPIFEMGF